MEHEKRADPCGKAPLPPGLPRATSTPMPRYTITGPLGPEAIDYFHVIADSLIEALWRLHPEALGAKAVRLEGVRLACADPADREMRAGMWWIVAVPTDAADRGVAIEISAVGPAEGQRVAA